MKNVIRIFDQSLELIDEFESDSRMTKIVMKNLKEIDKLSELCDVDFLDVDSLMELTNEQVELMHFALREIIEEKDKQ